MLPLHPATSGHARLARIAVDPAVDQLATPRPRAPQSTPQGSAGHGSLASWRPLRVAYALLDALGINRDSCGQIALSELRTIVTDPARRSRLDTDGLGRYADELERLATAERTEDEVHVVWG